MAYPESRTGDGDVRQSEIGNKPPASTAIPAGSRSLCIGWRGLRVRAGGWLVAPLFFSGAQGVLMNRATTALGKSPADFLDRNAEPVKGGIAAPFPASYTQRDLAKLIVPGLRPTWIRYPGMGASSKVGAEKYLAAATAIPAGGSSLCLGWKGPAGFCREVARMAPFLLGPRGCS